MSPQLVSILKMMAPMLAQIGKQEWSSVLKPMVQALIDKMPLPEEKIICQALLGAADQLVAMEAAKA